MTPVFTAVCPTTVQRRRVKIVHARAMVYQIASLFVRVFRTRLIATECVHFLSAPVRLPLACPCITVLVRAWVFTAWGV